MGTLHVQQRASSVFYLLVYQTYKAAKEWVGEWGQSGCKQPNFLTQCCVLNRATTVLQKSLARFHVLGFV